MPETIIDVVATQAVKITGDKKRASKTYVKLALRGVTTTPGETSNYALTKTIWCKDIITH